MPPARHAYEYGCSVECWLAIITAWAGGASVEAIARDMNMTTGGVEYWIRLYHDQGCIHVRSSIHDEHHNTNGTP